MDFTAEPAHRKVLVTGTGRGGTSFTMQVFTALGLPTGFDVPGQNFFTDRMCGQEVEVPANATRDQIAALPRIVKDPRLIINLRALIESGALDPIHVYVLIRPTRDAARSRVERGMQWDPITDSEHPDFASLPREEQVDAQVDRLRAGLGMLLVTLALHEVPFTTVLFPRLALDAGYFADAFQGVLVGRDRAEVLDAHAMIANPEAIHYGSGAATTCSQA